ncbi:MAG: PcfB family protein [Tissierellia bacterium]|nr:PcfB family protein [Tissierellia bacterium]
MINEEISNKTLHMEVQATKVSAKLIEKLIKDLIQKLDQKKQSLDNYLKGSSKEVAMKDMVKKGQLEELEVKESDLKELKKELNKHGVRFSLMKDKSSGNYSVFFQAKDTAVMEKAFRNALANVEQKEAKKDSVVKAIDKFKQTIKETVTKDKVKNKQKEQSL